MGPLPKERKSLEELYAVTWLGQNGRRQMLWKNPNLTLQAASTKVLDIITVSMLMNSQTDIGTEGSRSCLIFFHLSFFLSYSFTSMFPWYFTLYGG